MLVPFVGTISFIDFVDFSDAKFLHFIHNYALVVGVLSVSIAESFDDLQNRHHQSSA